MADVSVSITSKKVKTISGAASTTTATSANPTGPAAGDLGGNFPNPVLASTINTAIDFTAATISGVSTYTAAPIADAYLLNSSLWNTAYGWGNWATGVDKTFVDGLGVDAATLGLVAASNYARTDIAETFNDQVTLQGDGANEDILLRFNLDGGRDWTFRQSGSGAGTHLLLRSESSKDFILNSTSFIIRNPSNGNTSAVFNTSAQRVDFYYPTYSNNTHTFESGTTFNADATVNANLSVTGTITENGNVNVNAGNFSSYFTAALGTNNVVTLGNTDPWTAQQDFDAGLTSSTGSFTGVLSLSQEIVSTKAGEVADLRGANSRINWNPSNAGIRAYIEYIDNTQLNIAAGVGFINMLDNVTVNGDINWTGSSSGNHSGTFGTYGINRFMILDDSPVPTFSNGDVPVYQSADGFFSNLTLSTVATTGSYNDLSDQPTFGWTIAADAGSETINSGDTLTITGGLNASTTYTPATNTLEIDFAGASTPTLQQVTTAGATTTDSITVDDLTATGFVFATEQLYSDRDGEAVQLRGSNARINWNPNNAGLKAYIEYIDNTQLNISAGTGFVNFVENVTVNGTLTATSFSGNGASITNVVASNSSQLGGIDAVNYMRLDSAAGAQNMYNNITFDLGGAEKTVTGNASIDISGAIDAGGNLISGANVLASSGYIKTDAPTTGTSKWWKLGNKITTGTSYIADGYLEAEVDGHGLVQIALRTDVAPT